VGGRRLAIQSFLGFDHYPQVQGCRSIEKISSSVTKAIYRVLYNRKC